MAKAAKARLISGLKRFFKLVLSRRAIPVFKGTLCYVIALSLIFTRKFDNLSKYPPALTAMIIVTIAGGPGKPFGACLQGAGLAMGGVLLGSAFFAILAKLAHVPVAQGIVFAIYVYVMSVIKTFGQKFFVISLLSILMAFNGIYTSILLNGVFSVTYLLEYLKSYAWGAAIVLAVNILVFPRTSERELRQAIVTSLEHIATFAALLGKAYTLTGKPEDKAARELLSETIKADFTFLTQKIDETSVEINWSKYSMQDYQLFTDRIRTMQRTLITAHISLMRFDEKDVEVFRDDILPPTKLAFMKLRKDIDLTIREIGTALGCGPMFIAATQSGYLECLKEQREATMAGKPVQKPHLLRTATARTIPKDLTRADTIKFDDASKKQEGEQKEPEIESPEDDEDGDDDVEENLRKVARRLQAEIGTETPGGLEATRPGTPSRSRDRSTEREETAATPSPTHERATVGGSTAVATPGAGTSKTQGSPISPKAPLPSSTQKIPKGEVFDSQQTGGEDAKKRYGPAMMKQHFNDFECTQKDVLVKLLTSADSGENGELNIHQPGPSISEMYGGDYLRGNVEEGDLPTIWDRARKNRSRGQTPYGGVSPMQSRPESIREKDREGLDEDLPDDEDDEDEKKQREKRPADDDEINLDGDSVGPTPQFKRNETLVRVYSLLFAWDNFVEILLAMHAEAQIKRSKRIHVHVYESMIRPGGKPMPDATAKDTGMDKEADEDILREDARQLSIQEALALLDNKPFTPETVTLAQKIGRLNRWFSSERSVFALKSAAAASVFATLIFAETTRSWFINYSLTAGLLTCIVALAPTLGQSLLTFVLQISGSGFGTLVGWAILQMFKNVGGYSYNPFGMVAVVGVFAIPLQYCIYEKPQLFVLALLALNSAATILVVEELYVNFYERKNFDTPALRAGKLMTALVIALGIVIIFQLFILRNPARRTLRKALGNLVYANLAYNTILQAYVRAVLPADPKYRGKPVVLRRIERELKHREAKMQMQIIELSPLVVFANAEPSFKRPFRGDVVQSIVQANQIILDRLREGRAAIGGEPFDPYILENLVAVLSPYRRRAARINKAGLYLCAMSLMSKSPLPHDSVLAQHLLNHFVHDALLLSSRLTRTEEGAKAVRSDSFTRYWFYLISVSGLQTQLKRIEAACKELFGELEDDPRIQ